MNVEKAINCQILFLFIRDYSKLDHVENTQDFNERAFNYEVLQVIVK